MIGLSTAWFSESALDADSWVNTMQALRVAGLELEYRVPHHFFRRLAPLLKKKDLQILSVHNFFPFPDDYNHLKPSGDLFLLTSTDGDEREKAINYSVKTIEQAHDLGCSAVVLHLGKVEMESHFPAFCRFYENQKIGSPAMEQFLTKLQQQRKDLQPKFLDAGCRSLDVLAREAERRQVRLGVENRYYFHEIPNVEEFDIIFNRFAGAPVYHWHDVGHGFVQEQFGIQKHREYLEKFGNRLLGVHLHDANGYADHLAPGSGTMDFTWLKQYVHEDTIKIMEIHPHEGFEKVQQGLAVLQELFG